ncbi:hypothetical protein [Lentibacillus saliphilus]|uniref:hypothetical protein n=1 Tax=Lentibacillus saliphilus TaxID=2737028 RepID=UPI001C2F2AAF|nr:hypothetical protein [Lentibacillus saliphilus]
MKKSLILIVFSLIILLGGCINSKSDNDKQSAVATTNLSVEVSLNEAISIAYQNAVNWDKKAQLYRGTSVDNDEGITGGDGKRRYWDILFGIPDTNKIFLVQIQDAEIKKAIDITSEDDTPIPKNYFIDNSEIKFDTPELLKKAKEITELYPGDDWAKGYNFRIAKDIDKSVILIDVIGWNKKRDEMKGLQFNANTGELYKNIEGSG